MGSDFAPRDFETITQEMVDCLKAHQGLDEKLRRKVVEEIACALGEAAYLVDRKGQESTFEMLDGAQIKIVHEGDRLNIRGINNGPYYLDALTVLPHADNTITVKPRTRLEAGMDPLPAGEIESKPH